MSSVYQNTKRQRKLNSDEYRERLINERHHFMFSKSFLEAESIRFYNATKHLDGQTLTRCYPFGVYSWFKNQSPQRERLDYLKKIWRNAAGSIDNKYQDLVNRVLDQHKYDTTTAAQFLAILLRGYDTPRKEQNTEYIQSFIIDSDVSGLELMTQVYRRRLKHVIDHTIRQTNLGQLPLHIARPLTGSITKRIGETYSLNKTASDYTFNTALTQQINDIQPWIKASPVALDADYDEIRELANYHSFEIERLEYRYRKSLQHNDKETLKKIERRATWHIHKAIGWTRPGKMTVHSMLKRFSLSKTWVRQFNKLQKKSNLQIARITQAVGVGRNPHAPSFPRDQYLPTNIIRDAHRRLDNYEEWMRNQIIECNEATMTLWDIAGNAEERRLNELSLRVLAQHDIAAEKGFIGHLLTITCPSRFHPTYTIKRMKNDEVIQWSEPNPRFDPALSARDGVIWINKGWTKARPRIHRLYKKHGYNPKDDWLFFGDLEGHSDATPHRHIVLYLPAELVNEIKKILEDVFLWEKHYGHGLSSDEVDPGAQEHRIDLEPFREGHGAVAYALKTLNYTLKTIIDGGKARPNAEALYASSIDSRRFIISEHNIGIWRFLRDCNNPDHLPDELRRVWHHAKGIVDLDLEKLTTGGIFNLPRNEPRNDYKHGSCFTEDMLAFLKSPAQHYRPLFTESDLYDIELKTLSDYADDDGEITFPEFETIRRGPGAFSVGRRIDGGNTSYDRYLSDWHSFGSKTGTDAEGNAIHCRNFARHFERKLNSFDEPITPNRFDKIFRVTNDGEVLVGHNPFKKRWERNHEKSAKLRNQIKKEREAAINRPKPTKKIAISIPKSQELQLSIYCQEPASQSCKTPQTIDLLSPEQIIEKFSERYGEALRDENGNVITDITGLPRIKSPGTVKEPRVRRDFKPYYSPP